METNEHPIRKIPRHKWPIILKEIADVIGPESALDLFIRFNWRHLFVTKKPESGHLICQIIGEEKSILFCQIFARCHVVLPKLDALIREQRNEEIKRDWLKGMIQADIATKYNLSERQINGIINKKPVKGFIHQSKQ